MRKILLLACLLAGGCANLDREARNDDTQCTSQVAGRGNVDYPQCRPQLAGRAPLKPGQIRCQAGVDCDRKWARAARWVTEYSGLEIQTQTGTLIKTAQSKQDSGALVVTITKNATIEPGIYEIDFTGGCPSIFSCTPPAGESRARFTEFLTTPE